MIENAFLGSAFVRPSERAFSYLHQADAMYSSSTPMTSQRFASDCRKPSFSRRPPKNDLAELRSALMLSRSSNVSSQACRITATTKFCSGRANNVLSGRWFCCFPISKPLTSASFHDVVCPCYWVSVSFPFRDSDELVERLGASLFASAFALLVFDQFAFDLFHLGFCLWRGSSASRANGHGRGINGIAIQALAAGR